MPTHKSFCRFCHAVCGIEVDIADGRAVAVRGDKAHPISQGYLCVKGRALLEQHAHPDRLRGARARLPEGGWRELSSRAAMDEIATRLLAAEASIGMHNLRKGNLEEREWTKIANVRGAIADAPLYIDDSPNMTLVEIRAKCRRLSQRIGLKLVVIDYLQLMTSGKKVESRQQEVSEFSRALKLLAKELNVPVIALSQLNRNAEQRADKKPALSDLRESGSIEQDADMVVLLHREAAYEKESPRAGEADLIVAKHRNGPTRDITVAFQGHYSRFVDMAH